MGTEQLYFIIGFLLGTLITGCLCVAGFVVWYEWFGNKQINNQE